MDLKKGLRPVKLYELAELVKRSIQDACPHLIAPEFPSLQQVVEPLQPLESGTRESAEGQIFYDRENKYPWKICELLRPLFASLPSAHFNCIYTTINKFVKNSDLFVTFTPRSL